MSLKVDDRKSRGRSKSPGGRERDRSRSNVRVPEAPEPPSAAYNYAPTSSAMPGSFDNGVTSPAYDVRSPTGSGGNYFSQTSQAPHNPYAPSTTRMPSMPGYPPEEEGGFTMGGYTDLPPHERPGYVAPQEYYNPPPSGQPSRRDRDRDDDLAYGSSDSSRESRPRDRLSRESSHGNSNYRYTPQEYRPQGSQYQYAQPPDKLKYTTKPSNASTQHSASYTATPYGQPPSHSLSYTPTANTQVNNQLQRTYSNNAYDRNAQIVDITPGHEHYDRNNSSSKPSRLSTHQSSLSAPGASGLGPRMDRLSVSGNRPDMHSLGGGNMPPPSPLLEAYRGTYQSISPMPLAIRPTDNDSDLSDLSDLEPLTPTHHRKKSSSSHQKKPSSKSSDPTDRLTKDLATKEKEKEKKRVKLYDPSTDAKLLASALSHHKPDPAPLCTILPPLTHDQIILMRKEYKKQVKVSNRGVSLPKHINLKLSGNFKKAVYVTALGRWESEGYWANFFYQTHASRRELLIEALMGRTNADVRMIKEEFRDKRYGDSLSRCMEKELRMDKFRTAVLMVLEERRQEEQDAYPMEYVVRDVEILRRSVEAEKGGESAMLEIIVRRSDAHLREVLRGYERIYGENFARKALGRSNNLVGEVIAHILNGVINKPARDSLLLQHAIKDIAEKNKDDDLRYELLISRLVRIHWDKTHLARVKKAYYEKYRTTLEDAIEEATKGDFREFMYELCETK